MRFSGRRQAECRAHRPVEPGVHLGFGRPRALIEAAEDEAVDGEEPRFQKAVDRHARMLRLAPAHGPVGGKRGIEPGIFRRR